MSAQEPRDPTDQERREFVYFIKNRHAEALKLYVTKLLPQVRWSIVLDKLAAEDQEWVKELGIRFENDSRSGTEN